MIDVPDIPPESLVSSYEAYRAIRALKCNKARGLDGISNRILETFIFELSPVIADLYDTLMREGFVPSLLKRVIVRPSEASTVNRKRTEADIAHLPHHKDNEKVHALDSPAR